MSPCHTTLAVHMGEEGILEVDETDEMDTACNSSAMHSSDPLADPLACADATRVQSLLTNCRLKPACGITACACLSVTCSMFPGTETTESSAMESSSFSFGDTTLSDFQPSTGDLILPSPARARLMLCRQASLR